MMEKAIQEACALLRNGELVVVPTETVYGLGGDAENPRAIAKIYALKGRPAHKPLIVHIPGASHLDRWARDIPAYARALGDAFWPGPLSLVLKRDARASDAVTAGQDTVALRVPHHPVALRLLARFGGGIAAPSANRYGRISPTTTAHVRDEFGPQTPFMLDGGPATGGIESTIVACLDDEARILRPGLLSAATIHAVTGLRIRNVAAEDEQVRTAGQDGSHYAPRTPTALLEHGWPDADLRIGYLGFAAPPKPVRIALQLPVEPTVAARMLYAALRRLDEASLDVLVIQSPPAGEAWAGIRDRIARATAAT